MTRDRLAYEPITIPVGFSLSQNSVSLQGYLLVGIAIPSAFDGGSLTFQVGLDTTTFRDFYAADGVEKKFVVAANQHMLVVPEDFAGVPFLKIRAGTASAPSVQVSTDTTLTLILRPI